MEIQSTLRKILQENPVNLFGEFLTHCRSFYELPAHSFTEMRTRENKKLRGDIFEDFCVLYLKHVKKFTNAWRLDDVPEDVRVSLSLGTRDLGIDIVAENGGVYSAVQCKYKKHATIKKNVLSWKQLSTFYALCMRTGPWDKYIVMTNCDYARHVGKKTPKDISICLKTFQNITNGEWMSMCEMEESMLTPDPVSNPKSLEELRAARIKALGSGGTSAAS
jgi:predicted helicase